MATPPDVIRAELAAVGAAVTADLLTEVASSPLENSVDVLLEAVGLVVPAYYDAAGLLAVSWYDELREESRPATTYVPDVIGDPTTDWIEREIAKFQRTIEADIENEMQRLIDETLRLAEKEVARGYRDTILGNTRQDADAIGWSRVTRPGACKFCVMLAGKGAVYRSEGTAIFAAHADCHCAARPAFRNGEHGPEASVEQYLASSKRRTPEQRALLRKYLNQNYSDAPS